MKIEPTKKTDTEGILKTKREEWEQKLQWQVSPSEYKRWKKEPYLSP